MSDDGISKHVYVIHYSSILNLNAANLRITV